MDEASKAKAIIIVQQIELLKLQQQITDMIQRKFIDICCHCDENICNKCDDDFYCSDCNRPLCNECYENHNYDDGSALCMPCEIGLRGQQIS